MKCGLPRYGHWDNFGEDVTQNEEFTIFLSYVYKGRVQKFMLGELVDFSIKWVGGVPLVH